VNSLLVVIPVAVVVGVFRTSVPGALVLGDPLPPEH
jgi:hypothetical protein